MFCVNDLMAFGALDHLRSAGLRVPDDISIIGFDDVPMAAWASYRLTTLRQDPARIAKEVVSILDRRHAEPDLPPMSVCFLSTSSFAKPSGGSGLRQPHQSRHHRGLGDEVSRISAN